MKCISYGRSQFYIIESAVDLGLGRVGLKKICYDWTVWICLEGPLKSNSRSYNSVKPCNHLAFDQLFFGFQKFHSTHSLMTFYHFSLLCKAMTAICLHSNWDHATKVKPKSNSKVHAYSWDLGNCLPHIITVDDWSQPHWRLTQKIHHHEFMTDKNSI